MLARMRQNLLALSPSIRFMGPVMWVAWLMVIYGGDPFFTDSSAYECASRLYAISTVSVALMLILASFIPHRVTGVLRSSRAMAAVALIGSIATVVVLFPDAVPALAYLPACVLTGVTTAFIALRAAAFSADVDTQMALLASVASIIGGVLVYSLSTMLTTYFGPAASATLCVLALPLSVFMLFLADDQVGGLQDEASSNAPASYGRLLVCVGVLSLAFSCVRGYYPNYLDAPQFDVVRGWGALGLVAVGVVIIAAVSALPRDARFGKIFIGLFVLMTLCLVIQPLFGLGTSSTGIIGDVLFGYTMAIIWVLLSSVSYKTGSSSTIIMGKGFGVAALGSMLGFVIGGRVFSLGIPELVMTVVVVLVVLVSVLAAMLMFSREDYASLVRPMPEESFGWRDDSAIGDASVPQSQVPAPKPVVARFKMACELVALEYGLTARESEVLFLLAKGKSAETIAGELYVGFNTVRTHIRKIYAKLDVHSKDELMTVVEARRASI